MDAKMLAGLLERLPEWHLRQRLQRQIKHTVMRLDSRSLRVFDVYWENFDLMPKMLGLLLRLTGQLEAAQRATLAYEVCENEVVITGLPSLFDGYRILHLSDLHIDRLTDGGHSLNALLATLSYDLCVLTGDYRFDTCGPCEETMQGMKYLLQGIHCADGIVGVMGNHDFLEMLPELEALGITMLMNEVTTVKRGQHCLWIAGLDDCHYYEVADIDSVQDSIPQGAPFVLLVHSPEMINQAAAAGASLYLCGHTHGGQVCLPGGTPLIINARCARRFAKGRWQSGPMHGYTSSGIGTSGIPARIHCPPEIAVHILRCSRSQSASHP